jgi:hypothetical protein
VLVVRVRRFERPPGGEERALGITEALTRHHEVEVLGQPAVGAREL